MTVEELIKELERYPKDAKVTIDSGDWYDGEIDKIEYYPETKDITLMSKS